MSRPLRVVWVRWTDAQTNQESWVDLSDLAKDKMPIIDTVGLLVYEGPRYIWVCQSYDQSADRVDHCVLIPKGMIINEPETLLELPARDAYAD